MIKNNYNVIGVMSGTSLDGIDLVYTTFKYTNNNWSYKIQCCCTIPYPKEWQEKLKDIALLSIEAIKKIDLEYTIYLSGVIKNFIKINNINDICAVCSHGHTALHQPKHGITYQIGNLPQIADLLKQTVVCNFREQDVALGGQGAPLVPIGDRLLFSEYNYCLNLGGFANISMEIENNRQAYDICPVNNVLNHYASKQGLAFDDKGQIARSGIVNTALLKALNSLPFYSEKPPKSLGIEWVNQYIFPLIDCYKLQIKDILRTFTEHVALQISRAINNTHGDSILITGGGAYNNFLIETLQHKTKNTITIPSKTIIEFKEALVFGLLGVLKLRGDINCLSSVTGSKQDHSCGIILDRKNMF